MNLFNKIKLLRKNFIIWRSNRKSRKLYLKKLRLENKLNKINLKLLSNSSHYYENVTIHEGACWRASDMNDLPTMGNYGSLLNASIRNRRGN